ncbi:MAG TPA: carboxypeptidase-like regulatory domain-containing protein, partial [Candidatus Obscuribacterales bacterium]
MPRTAPSPTAAPAVYEQSNASGTGYDDQGRPLDGVTIRAEQVSGPAGFVQSTLTSQGRFRLVAVPVGTLIRLLATKTGYGERSLTVLVKAGCDGGPGCNVFDFGVPAGRIDESSFSNALSRGLKVLALEKPETGYFQPWIRLRFDRPVDRAGFEQALQVRGPKPECWQAAGGVSDDALVTVLDAAALNFSWDADSRAVSVQLKDGLHLPPLDAAAHGCSRTGYRLSLHDADGQALFNDRQGQPAARYLYHLADQESDLRDFFFDPQQTGPLQLQQVQARDLAAGDELLLRFN